MVRQKRCWCQALPLVGLSAALGVALAGCGKDDFVPVKGRVFYKGKPLTKGSVAFIPDKSKGNASMHRPQGIIDAEGYYQLISSNKVGVMPGPYVVTVDTTYDVDTRDPRPPKSVAPLRYWDPKTSGLTVEVRRDAPPGSYDLDLKP